MASDEKLREAALALIDEWENRAVALEDNEHGVFKADAFRALTECALDLRAALSSSPAEPWEDDAALVRRAVEHPRRECGLPLWSDIGRVFNHGSGYSINLCKRLGRDPHEVHCCGHCDSCLEEPSDE